MKCLKNKSIIAAGLTALSALALGVGVISSGTATGVGPEFIGSYNLTAYAEESSSSSVDRITVAGKEVDFISSAQFLSDNGDYALCLTVIDMADFGADFTASLQVGYEIAEDLFFNGNDSGLSNVVYSSLTFANGSLSVSDLSLSDSFKLPYFIVAEVPVININNEIFNFIVAEKHNTEPVSGQAATCTVDGWKDYYVCVDDNKYFTDSWCLHEIADLEAWKTGDGKIGAFGHTEVTEEAIAATCTEAGLTEGKHCSVCGEVLVAQSEVKALGHTYLDGYEDEYCTVCSDHKEVVKTVNGVNYTLAYDTESGVSRYFIASGKAEDFDTEYYANEANTLVLENEIDGFPVTEIAAEALANKNGDATTSIKNIVVPANIVTVGEKAFLDNFNIKSTAFLAQNVTLCGEAGTTKTVPFYGCTTESANTETRIAVYYHEITGVENWGQVRRSGTTGYVIGKNGGGALYSSGWDYATANAVIDLNGVEGSTLTEDAANEILAKYYPALSTTTFAIDEELDASLKVDFAQFDMVKDGISYKCVYNTELTTVGLYSVVTYTVSYEEAAIINVYSGVGFTYHGMTVAANEATEVVVVVSDGNLVLETPVAEGYVFLGYACESGESLVFSDYSSIVSAEKTLYVIWGCTRTEISVDINASGTSTLNAPKGDSIDGKWYKDRANWEEVTEISTENLVVYTRSIFGLSIYLNRGGTDTNRVFVEQDGGSTSNYKISGNLVGGSTYVTQITIYEGEATLTISDKVLNIVTDKVSYNIYVKEINWLGKDTNNRDISSDKNGIVYIEGNLDITLSY